MPKNTDYLNYVLRGLKQSAQDSIELYHRTGSERRALHQLFWNSEESAFDVLAELEMYSGEVAGHASTVRHQCGCDRFDVDQANNMIDEINKRLFRYDAALMLVWFEDHMAEYPLLFEYVKAIDQIRCQLESFCYWFIDQGGVKGGERTK